MSKELHVHIICLNVPYPADYGGSIDMFYKIVALNEAGIRIHLHCFEYGRGPQPELNKYCSEVHYYRRRTGHKGFSLHLPYTVSSRINETLFERLLEDDYPILMEGIHCSYLLQDPRFDGRKLLLRLHNTESEYYSQLRKQESRLWKKWYFGRESRLLKHYEQGLAGKVALAAIAGSDIERYRAWCPSARMSLVPAFHPFRQLDIQPGKGCFCLYQGDLSVPENEKAATWLLEKVFGDMKIPLVIAGRNPSRRLTHLAHRQAHTCLVASPSDKEMNDLIRKAQINLVPAFITTGLKLKLVYALFNGRHCVANTSAVEGTGLEPACHLANDAGAFKKTIQQLYDSPFGEEECVKRAMLLNQALDLDKSTREIIRLLS